MTTLARPEIKSEARLTFAEATAMIVGHSIGGGILAVPYLATRNNWWDLIIIVVIAYMYNVVLHLVLSELSYNNGGTQMVKSLERFLFVGKLKKVFTWALFILYGFTLLLNIAGFIDGASQAIAEWLPNFPTWSLKLIFFAVAGSVVLIGMKAVGISQKIAVFGLIGVFVTFAVASIFIPKAMPQPMSMDMINWMGLLSAVVFAQSANQAVIQSVKGLNGDTKKIRASVFSGIGISAIMVIIISLPVMFILGKEADKEIAILELAQKMGGWAVVLATLFTLLALTTTFWSTTLNLRDMMYEQVKGKINYKLCWLIVCLPSFLIAMLNIGSFLFFTMLVQGVAVFMGVIVVIAYYRSRKIYNFDSPICGKLGSLPILIIMLCFSLFCSVGALVFTSTM